MHMQAATIISMLDVGRSVFDVQSPIFIPESIGVAGGCVEPVSPEMPQDFGGE
jgi:hypothetical protein